MLARPRTDDAGELVARSSTTDCCSPRWCRPCESGSPEAGDRRTIDSVSLGAFLDEVGELTADLRRASDPVAAGGRLAGLGYSPDQSVAQRSARLALLNLAPAVRQALADRPTAGPAARERARQCGTVRGQRPRPTEFHWFTVGRQLDQQLLHSAPTVLGLVAAGEVVADEVDLRLATHPGVVTERERYSSGPRGPSSRRSGLTWRISSTGSGRSGRGPARCCRG